MKYVKKGIKLLIYHIDLLLRRVCNPLRGAEAQKVLV